MDLNNVTLLDMFAMMAPEPTTAAIQHELQRDAARNPHGDYHKPRRRSSSEIVADLKYAYAHEMNEARGRLGRGT